ncbi:MAG: ribosome recycling factor [Saprospiraceae bacterium]
MQEEVDFYLETAVESMNDAVEHFKKELSKIRTGKASPNIFDGLMVSYYGSPTPMKQIANVSVPDARTIVIKPWEKPSIPLIEKAIFQANMGFTPQNDGDIIRISVPPLTEERRRELVKQSKKYLEDAKISIRNARRDAITEIKAAVKEGYSEDAGKNAEEQADALGKKHYALAEALIKAKETDIMTV